LTKKILVFLHFFLIFDFFFWIFPDLLGIGSGRDGMGFRRSNESRQAGSGLRRVGFKTDFFVRSRPRPVGSNGTDQVRSRVESRPVGLFYNTSPHTHNKKIWWSQIIDRTFNILKSQIEIERGRVLGLCIPYSNLL
jgi:hypothetical protein